MISKQETIKRIDKLSAQLKVLDEKKELRIMEYEEKLSILKENTDKEKEMELSQIEEKYKAQKLRLDEDQSAKIAQLDEMKSAISSEKDKYDKVLEAIITQENAVKALLGENY